MRMMHKRLLWAFALVIALSFSYNAQHALAYTGSGSCGAKARWALNDDGILTISGTGPMTDYQISTAPWYAYFIRDNIKQIVIEEGITTVGTYAFMSLWNVTDVYLPSTLKEIHDHGFLQEKGLERIHFSEGLETIGEEAFMDCESLIQAELPHSLLAMGSAVFKRCLNLSAVDVRENVTAIPENAFFQCESLTSIRIGEGVTAIGSGAFAFTLKTGLKMTVWLPDNITTGIGLHIMDYDRVYVHAGSQTADHLKGISDYPFIDPDYPDYLLNFVNDPLKNGSGYCLSAYRRLTDTLEFNWPTQVTVIGNRLFKQCADLTEITIPDGIQYIDWEAFYGCSNLRKVVLPDSVIAIGDAFCNCTSLTDINLPDQLQSFSFKNCSSLTHIDIPDSVTLIGGQFITGTAIRELRLPGGLLKITNSAFMESKLIALSIPSTVTSIGRNAFYNCYELTELNIPDSVITMDEQCFMNCVKLKHLRLPARLTEVPNRMVAHCSSLETVFIPATVTTFGYDAFEYCNNLKMILCYSGSEAESYCKLHALPYMLVDAENSSVMRLPSRLEQISEEMMMGTRAQEYVVPASVKRIEKRAFADLQKNAIIRLTDNVAYIADDAFEGSCVVLYCPPDCYAAAFADTHGIQRVP